MSVGCLAYDDDITLISRPAGRIQNMLNVCEDFAQENLKFNVQKNVATLFK